MLILNITVALIRLLDNFLNRPFAAFHSRGTKPPCWDAKVALGQDQQQADIILNGNFLCLSCPSAMFASPHGGFVPREWKAAKGLFKKLSSNRITTVIFKISKETLNK